MNTILLNKKSVRQNKKVKTIHKLAKRKYKRPENPVIKSKICKFVTFTGENIRVNSQNRKETNPIENLDELLRVLEQEKLTGMSGNGFLVVKKLKTFIKSTSKERCLIVNAVECEPGLLHDEWLLNNHFELIIKAIQYILDILKLKSCIFATKKEINVKDERIQVNKVPARYPMGEEHILIQQLLGKKLQKQCIPAKEGILVMNVQTLLQIYFCAMGNHASGRLITTVNIDNGEATVAYIEYGTNIKEYIKEQYGNVKNCYAGGGIMSAHQVSEKECFDAQVSFVAIGHAIVQEFDEKCKGCGRCSKVCPMGIDVRKLVKAKENKGMVSEDYVSQCIHCNSCSFVCAAHKNIPEFLK